MGAENQRNQLVESLPSTKECATRLEIEELKLE